MKKVVQLLLSLLLLFAVTPTINAKTLDEIKNDGKITMGANPEYPPFEFVIMKDGKKEYVGIDFDLAQLIADEIGVELEFSEVAFNALIPTLQADKIDMIVSGMTYTDERAKQVDFSDFYFETYNQFIVPKDDEGEYKEVSDFKGKKIGVLKASVQEILANKILPDNDIVPMNKNGDVIEALKAGRVDAVIMDSIVVDDFVSQNKDKIIAVDDVVIEDAEVGKSIAVKKDNKELLETINKVINEAKANGTLDEIIEKNSGLVDQAIKN